MPHALYLINLVVLTTPNESNSADPIRDRPTLPKSQEQNPELL